MSLGHEGEIVRTMIDFTRLKRSAVWFRNSLFLLSFALFALASNPAQATTDTLKRAVGNIVQAPLDLVLSPVVAGTTMVNDLREIDDSLGVKIAYPVPAFLIKTTVHMGASVIRGVSGVLELFPGMGLLFSDNDMDPLFDLVDRVDPLVEAETPVMDFRFGLNYTGSGY